MFCAATRPCCIATSQCSIPRVQSKNKQELLQRFARTASQTQWDPEHNLKTFLLEGIVEDLGQDLVFSGLAGKRRVGCKKSKATRI